MNRLSMSRLPMDPLSRRHGFLRSLCMALIATGMCTACSAPAPPQATPDADATQTATSPSGSADPSPAPPATTSETEPAAGSSAPQPPDQAPAPSPKPTAAPAATEAPQAPYEPPPAPIASDTQPAGIVVTTLSRGKGVPEETRAAYKQIRAVLERQQAASNVTAMQANRIGLEGETRLCAEFRSNDDAQAALAEIRKLSAGVDMLNVAIEPCPSRKVDKP